ncbi:hypothetical protein ACH47X_10845 [Promicromonospora kroppenstedtii]|uniref:VWFA domain-containing protein n=1 Tax=Promicromonospora kroppenstedtii TaxID=440482 RepID=A0ABW7XJ64_9MICO
MTRRTPSRTAWCAALGALLVLGGTGVIPAGASGPPPVRSAVLPVAVPAPAPDESVVTVVVGGDRTGTRTVAPLAGTTLGLFATADAADPVDPDWGLCTSDADGDCSFVVPDTAPGGANAGAQWFVRQVEAPSGWFTNPNLRTGPGSGSSSTNSPYVFQTPALAAGATYSSTSDFMVGTAGSGRPVTDSEGVWQQSRTNPTLPEQCGLDVALVLDLSSSVSSSELVALKGAADTFTDALVGTPSRMAVFSFDGASPSTSVGANVPDLANVATQAGADEFKAVYADWTTGSGTNWDRGLWAVADAAPDYELTVVITDGNPTRFSADPLLGTGGTTHFRDVENGIYSANAVKGEGSRLVALGVGDGVDDVTQLNLRALSGPTLFDGTNVLEADYFDADDYAEAGAALQDLALSQCQGSVSVFKEIVPAQNTGDDISGSVPAGAGWVFDASAAAPGVTVDPATATTTDDGTGGVSFDLEYPTGTLTSDVTVAETQQPGYELVAPGGQNAVCVNRSTGDPVAVTNVDDAARPGFVLDLPATELVSCTVYNRPSAGVVVDKEWVIDGETFADGEQPDGFTAQASLTGPGAAEPAPQPWGVAREGYDVGEAVTVDETAQVPEDCTADDAVVTSVDGDPAEAALPYGTTAALPFREVVVTNTVTCATPSPSPTPTVTPTPGPTGSPTPPGPGDGSTPPPGGGPGGGSGTGGSGPGGSGPGTSSPGAGLAATGADVTAVLGLTVVLLACGWALIRAARRRTVAVRAGDR